MGRTPQTRALVMDNFTDQIDSWVEEDPDQIDKVPVDRASLNTPVFFRRKMAFASQIPDNGNKAQAGENVQGMHAGHAAKTGPAHRGAVIGILAADDDLL